MERSFNNHTIQPGIWLHKSSKKKAPALRVPQTVKKVSQSLPTVVGKKIKSFSARACTWQKILLSPLVCELCAMGAQGVRAADCKKLAENPEWGFSTR